MSTNDRDALDALAYTALVEHDGNVTAASKATGIPRTSIRGRAARHEATLAQADEFDTSRAEYDDQADAQEYDETGNVPSAECETPASDFYAGPVADADTQTIVAAPAATRPCACLCGTQVARVFARGHDSKMLNRLRSAYIDGAYARDETLRIAGDVSPRFLGKVTKSLNRIDSGAAASYTPAAKTSTCRCGCGEACARTFVRGHDASYAKKLVTALRAGEMNRNEVLEASAAVSPAFGHKLVKALAREDAKAAAA